jgi:hypothetical protein
MPISSRGLSVNFWQVVALPSVGAPLGAKRARACNDSTRGGLGLEGGGGAAEGLKQFEGEAWKMPGPILQNLDDSGSHSSKPRRIHATHRFQALPS